MCQPKSKGGRRCAAHTRPHFERVLAMASEGDDAAAAREASKRFENIRDFAMTPEGSIEIEGNMAALEEHYFNNPSTSIEQETARQTVLATLDSAINLGRQRKEAITEALAEVKKTQSELDIAKAEAKAARREAARRAAAAAQEQERYGWALKAPDLEVSTRHLPEQSHATDDGFAALRYRLDNAVPGDEFTVTAGGDTMTVRYEESFDTFTGKTRYTLRAETPTSHSEATFISREHITANVQGALFSTGAWTDRRTLNNPRLEKVFAADYDRGLAEAAEPYGDVATYERLAAEDQRDLELARSAHREALEQWQASQQKREGNAIRRLLPTSPPPTMPTVERRVAPHPFGGMSKEEWVAYETENLRAGRTDLSEFTSHSGRSPLFDRDFVQQVLHTRRREPRVA